MTVASDWADSLLASAANSLPTSFAQTERNTAMTETHTASMEPRQVDAGHGVTWWMDAWGLFTRNAVMWVVLTLILAAIFFVFSYIPFLGGIAGMLLTPVFMGSWMLAAHKLDTGGTLEVGDLFLGFQGKLAPLLVLGGLQLACAVAMYIGVAALGVAAVAAFYAGGSLMAIIFAGMAALLVALIGIVLLSILFWFAPALVVLRNASPVEAIRASFLANLKNLLAHLVYGLITLVALFVATIPFGLGLLVFLPLALLTMYTSYKDVFGEVAPTA
jgi:hypothetical protein